MKNINQKQDVLLRLSQCREDSNRVCSRLDVISKRNQAAITQLESIIELLTRPEPYISSNTREGTSKAAIPLERLLRILSSSLPGPAANNGRVLDLEFLEMRDDDLHTVLSSTATIHPRSQSQAFSALNHDRLFEWMYRNHPDLIFIDGNCQVNATDSISPLSLLCARIGLTLAKMEPDNVFVHFYCGLHVDPGRNDWSGPDGMIRSILVQILAALVAKDIIEMSFLNRTSFIRDLENHGPDALCDLLYYLVRLFDHDTTIYCFINGVSRFDIDFRGIFEILKVIINRIERIVEDGRLKPKLKVLMTVPFRSSPRLRRIVKDEFHISLSPHSVGGQ